MPDQYSFLLQKKSKSSASAAAHAGASNLAVSLIDNRPQSIIQNKAVDTQSIGNTIIQRVSNVKYDTTAFDLELPTGEKEVVGKKMEAHLEQGDQLHGSAPGDGVQSLLMGTLKANGYKRMIRGHLLNGQLGGLGIAANLFPITASANSKHKNHVENPIKDQITKGKDVDYSVTVNSQNKVSDPNAEFICAASTTDGSWTRNETIQSEPSKSAISGATAEGGIVNGTDSVAFKTSDLPAGWGERGKGYTGSATHINTASKYNVSFEGGSQTLDGDLYSKGAHFNKGEIDRQGYAHELVEKYNEDVSNKWPIYFNSKPYSNKEINDLIDTSSSGDVEQIITRIEGLL